MPKPEEIKRRAIELVVGETGANLSLWEEVRSPQDAPSVLALWAAYHRFENHTELRAWKELDTVVQRDKEELCTKALQRLQDAPEDLEEEILEFSDDGGEFASLNLFRDVDECDLALWAIVQLVGDRPIERLAELSGGLVRVFRVFIEHLYKFDRAKPFARGMLLSFREFNGDDRLYQESALESTTEKHRALCA